MAVRTHWRRRLFTGTNAVFVTVLGVVVAVFAAELAQRVRFRVDLSADGSSTLLPALESAIESAEASSTDVEITAFSAQRRDAQALIKDRTMRDLLREMETRSSRVHTRFVDFDADRMSVEQKHVTRYGTVVVEARGDRVDVVERELFRVSGKKDDRQVEFLGEGALAKAVAAVTSGQHRVVYVLGGHGERRLDTGLGALKSFSQLLENQGVVVKKLDLVGERGRTGQMLVPDDAAAVLIVGPNAPFLPEEDRALAVYLTAGGAVGYFVEPGGMVAPFLEQLGVTVPSGFVLDRQFVVPFVDRPVLRYGRHPIAEAASEDGLVTVMPAPAPVVVNPPKGEAVPVLQTSKAGWIERSDEKPPEYTAGVDGEGPVGVATALSIPVADGHTARVVVVGDAEWVGDELLAEGPGNATVAVNLVRWLVGADDRLVRVGKTAAVRRVVMSDGQLSLVRAVVLAGMPLLALLAGVAVLATRRGR